MKMVAMKLRKLFSVVFKIRAHGHKPMISEVNTNFFNVFNLYQRRWAAFILHHNISNRKKYFFLEIVNPEEKKD